MEQIKGLINIVCFYGCSHLAHLALAVSSQEGHVVDLIHHHKILLFPLKVLLQKKHKNAGVNRKQLSIWDNNGINRGLTWDLDQKMKTSPTILKSSSAFGSGYVNHLALYLKREKVPIYSKCAQQ